MYIERKPSTIMTVIDRIYHPIAQNMGVTLLLRNEIRPEIQFPPRFFINLIQITGNLVANAIKYTTPRGLVDVVFTLNTESNNSKIIITVKDTGKGITPDLVAVMNQSNQAANLMSEDAEEDFGTRLEYVKQLVYEEMGHIFVTSERDAGTVYSLTLPIPNNFKNRKNGISSIVENDAMFLNGS